MDSLFSDYSQNSSTPEKNNNEDSFKKLLQSVSMDEEESHLEAPTPAEETPQTQTLRSYSAPPQYGLSPNFLDGMNPEQKEAVLHDQGSLLVLAGAGSGKTRVITHRFAYLVDKYKLRINNILCVTFTNKAAGEMKERISHLLGVSTKMAWIRTFHSMCAMILREHAERIGFSKDFTIYDATDTKNAIKRIMERLNIDPKTFNDKAIARAISSSKEELISPEEMKKSAKNDFDDICADVYREYQLALKQQQAMDFGDLITNTIILLEQCPDVRERYQRQWHFIMADEFQDTNKPQYYLLSLLSRNKNNICVVGDDDQSIYAWRGARVENIHQFHEEFQAHIIRLERNYRSYGNILEAANSIVKSIKGRMPKTLKAEREAGAKIEYRVLENDRSQAAYVYQEIQKKLSQGVEYKDIAVLYRTNAQSRILEEMFTRHQVPHKIYGGQRFFDRAEIKDILCYLRIMVNPQDQEAFDRIVNVPKRKIGDVGKEKITQYRQDNQCSFIDVCLQSTEISGMNKQSVFNLQQLGKVLSELRDSIDNYPPTEIVKILIESVRYFEDYLVPEYGSHEAEDRFENIQELVNAIQIFEQDNPDSSIADFLREASLLSTVDEDEENQDNFVSLMTIHSSKGLEFPIVFVIGLSEGVLPSYNERDGITDEKLDEEKRLLYVAITRAMNQLYLSYEEMSFRYGLQKENDRSQFLDSIPVELLNEAKTEKNYAMQRDSGTKNYGSYRFGNKSNSSKKTSPTMSPKQHTSGMQEALAIEQPTNHKTIPVNSIADLQEGTKVVHTMFGVGEVEYLSAAMAKVSFSKFGTQVMMGSAIKNLKKIVE